MVLHIRRVDALLEISDLEYADRQVIGLDVEMSAVVRFRLTEHHNLRDIYIHTQSTLREMHTVSNAAENEVASQEDDIKVIC